MLKKILEVIKALFFKYEVSVEEKEFIDLNRKCWDIKGSKEVGILVEGFLASPTSIVEKSRLANAAREVIEADAMVIVRGFTKKASNVVPIYESFGLNNFYYWWANYLNPFVLFPSLLSSFYVFFVLRNGAKLVKYKKDNVLIGDLIYDSLVRNIPNSYTVDKLSYSAHGRLILRAMVFYYGNRKILNENNIKVVVTSHNVYAEYGLLCRQAHARNSVIILKDMDVYKIYTNNMDIREHFLKPSRDVVEYSFNHSDMKREIDYYNSRVLGVSKQVDIQNAYINKRNYSKHEAIALHRLFDISKKNVFVMAHAFSDAPHVGGDLLFRDYYDFLEKTLSNLELNTNINCFVKSHPSSYMWGESGGVESIVERNSFKNICILPSDFNTASALDIADIVVTAKGTAGIEFSCAGIPAITAGVGYYHGFGICHEPATEYEYYDLLSRCHELKRLDNDVIRRSLIVLYQSFNNLHHSEVLPKTQLRPGDDYKLLFKSKFKELSDNLKSNKPMKDSFYKLVKQDLERVFYEK